MNLIDDVPKLRRGRVWCTECGRTMKVNSGIFMESGWPKCCGYTMTIDSPAERERGPSHSNGVHNGK